ncbi:MAG: 3-hydroxyacyl-ACP dehydratase FabZ [Acidobacteriota bacterium]|nr:3-hydroxyacyl-ACP dehydratase FabZ [Acidobacteriota bacterium]
MSTSVSTSGLSARTLDIDAIREILPHRYPFLLVDRIEELETERVVGIKNVTVNEPFFAGHFPDYPVMPGVLIIEAMAQVAGVLVLSGIPDRKNKLVMLAGVDGAKFRKPVRPGDRLRMEMKVLRSRPAMAKVSGTATVDGVVVAEAEILCVLADRQ